MPSSDDDQLTPPNPDAVDPREAADRAVEEGRLLDGEDPDSRHPDDIRHWIKTYAELVEYKERLLASSARDRDDIEDMAAVRETTEIDVPILRRELERYRRRLSFWEQREGDLKARGA